MKTFMTVVGVLFLGLAIFAGSVFMWGVGVRNDFAAQEKAIKAQYKQNQNNYTTYYTKIKDMVQVNDMYAGDFKKVYDSLMQGRYGKDGSKAMFQWIQEKMPNFDASMYKTLQLEISAGRDDFEANQKSLLSKKQTYEQVLDNYPEKFIADFAGYPTIDMTEYAIVTSEETEQVFKTKKMKPLKLRE